MQETTFEIPVGLTYNGSTHTTVELLRTNGIAEKVFVKKIADKPFTWQAYIVAVSVKSIGGVLIGAAVREEYLKSGEVTIPEPVMHLSLADMNTLLVEIHRRCWQDVIPKQQMLCKFCMKQLTTDIDLNNIQLSQEDKNFLSTAPDLSRITVYLKDGFMVDDTTLTGEDYEPYKGVLLNKLVYSVPNIRNAIANEKISDNSIAFWRRIAFDCLLTVSAVEFPETVSEKILFTLPEKANTFLGQKLYDLVLSGYDLKRIREELMEYLPTLPFFYEEVCPCERGLTIPYVMEATNFFSE